MLSPNPFPGKTTAKQRAGNCPDSQLGLHWEFTRLGTEVPQHPQHPQGCPPSTHGCRRPPAPQSTAGQQHTALRALYWNLPPLEGSTGGGPQGPSSPPVPHPGVRWPRRHVRAVRAVCTAQDGPRGRGRLCPRPSSSQSSAEKTQRSKNGTRQSCGPAAGAWSRHREPHQEPHQERGHGHRAWGEAVLRPPWPHRHSTVPGTEPYCRGAALQPRHSLSQRSCVLLRSQVLQPGGPHRLRECRGAGERCTA